MDETRFWKLLDEARNEGEDEETGVEELIERLQECAPGDIADFQRLLSAKLARVYSQELSAAEYALSGYTSADGFLYFAAWLVWRGREAYESVLAEPDTLPDFDPPDMPWCEPLLSAAATAYEAATGEELDLYVDEQHRPAFQGARFTPEQLPARFPRIWERFRTPEGLPYTWLDDLGDEQPPHEHWHDNEQWARQKLLESLGEDEDTGGEELEEEE
jgi:hypothetical protein